MQSQQSSPILQDTMTCVKEKTPRQKGILKILVLHTQTLLQKKPSNLQNFLRPWMTMSCSSFYRQEREQWECYLRDNGPHQPPCQHHCDERRQVVVNEVKILRRKEKRYSPGKGTLKPPRWVETRRLAAGEYIRTIRTSCKHSPNLSIRDKGKAINICDTGMSPDTRPSPQGYSFPWRGFHRKQNKPTLQAGIFGVKGSSRTRLLPWRTACRFSTEKPLSNQMKGSQTRVQSEHTSSFSLLASKMVCSDPCFLMKPR